MADDKNAKLSAMADEGDETGAEPAVKPSGEVPAADVAGDIPPAVDKAVPSDESVPPADESDKQGSARTIKIIKKPAARSAALPAKGAAVTAKTQPVSKTLPVSKSKPASKAMPKPATKPAARAANGTGKVKIIKKPAASKRSPAVADPVADKAPVTRIKPEARKAPPSADKPVSTSAPFAGVFPRFMFEDNTMDMSANYTAFQDVMTEAQAKAKAAFEKSSTVLGEVGEFTKGNVEAMVESGKILAEGAQGLGSELVAESRNSFTTFTSDIKELAAVKSPADFFKLQGELMRKSFDTAVAAGSKNSESMLKLMSDAMAPLSGRMSLAMDKARQISL